MTKSKTKIYNFRFDDEFIAAMDEWRERQPFPPSRTDLVKAAVHAFIGSPDFRQKKKAPREKATP